MSGDAIGQVERRIVSRPTSAEDIARQIRHNVDELNRLFTDAKVQGLQVELGVVDKKGMMELNDPISDLHIVINKLRVEKDF